MLVQCSLAVIVLAQAAAATLVADRAQAKRDIAAWGGYALLVKDKDCPNSTLDCGVASCCPKGTACNDEPSSGPVCCPNDKDDCSSTVDAVYTCSDTSWSLWESGYNTRFCCAADEWGTHHNLKDECLPKSIPVPSSIIVSSLKQLTNTAGGAPTTGIPNAPDTTPTTNPSTPQVPNPDPSEGGADSGSGRTDNTDNTDTRTSGSSGSTLSQPATIAIAVLSTVVALMAIFIVWILWDRERRQKMTTPPPQSQVYPGSPIPDLNPEPPAYMASHQPTQELHAQGAPSVLVIQQYSEVNEPELDGQASRQARDRA